MASRPIWRGHLRLALVSCPVALFNARHDRSTIRFNMINRDTGNRIKMVSQDAGTGAPIERGKTVKGYEFDKNRYLIVTLPICERNEAGKRPFHLSGIGCGCIKIWLLLTGSTARSAG
jgi:hypothetical protein